jgi:hypothetical protein
MGCVFMWACYQQKKHQGWATHRWYHGGEDSAEELESQRLDQLGRSLTWTCGSWDLHTVFQPIRGVCDERRWHAVNRTRSESWCICSPMLLAQSYVTSVGFHSFRTSTRAVRLCESLSTAFNYLHWNWNWTQYKKNKTHNPLQGDWWVSDMNVHAWRSISQSIWMKNNQNVSRMSVKIAQKYNHNK